MRRDGDPESLEQFGRPVKCVARESPASDANRAIVNVAWTSPQPFSRDMAASMDEAAALIGLVILVVLRGAAR